MLGNNTAHVISTATANQLALAMRLNEESVGPASRPVTRCRNDPADHADSMQSYEGLDPIESEIRRRIYWLLFQADKSTACLVSSAVLVSTHAHSSASTYDMFATRGRRGSASPERGGRRADHIDRDPAAADWTDTADHGIQHCHQLVPVSRHGLSQLWSPPDSLSILNDALLLQRRKAPPTVDSILADLQNVNELREKVMQTALEVATPLQLRKAYDSRVSRWVWIRATLTHNR